MLTPAMVLARAEHAEKAPAEKMKLLAPRALHATIDSVAAEPGFGALFAALADRPPANLAGVLVHTVGLRALHDNAAYVAAAVLKSAPAGERAASRFAGYMVHPHNYCADADTLDGKTAALRRQLGGQLEHVLAFFEAARALGEPERFFASCPAPEGASCHAVRINEILGAFAELRSADPLLSDALGDTDPVVLQRAYALVADDPTIRSLRARLATHGVSSARIDAIAAAYADTLDP